MNVSEDPTLLGMLLYDLKEGETKIGTKDADENHVKLNVLGIMTRHCAMYNEGGNISIEPNPDAKVFVNGALVTKRTKLKHLDRITLGHSNNFKLVIPGQSSPDELRESMLSGGQFGEYIDDKLSANTIEAKSMKQFLVELQQRLDKHNYAKFLEKFKSTFNDVD
jgi:pSer/pThr/pTyr-binding forkhead associated (FHA) protein